MPWETKPTRQRTLHPSEQCKRCLHPYVECQCARRGDGLCEWFGCSALGSHPRIGCPPDRLYCYEHAVAPQPAPVAVRVGGFEKPRSDAQLRAIKAAAIDRSRARKDMRDNHPRLRELAEEKFKR